MTWLPATCKGCGARVIFDAKRLHWLNEDGEHHHCPPARAA